MNTKVYKTNISPKFRKDNSASEIVDAMHFSTDNDYNQQEQKTEQFIYHQNNQKNINNRVDKESVFAKGQGRNYEFCYVNNDNPNIHENRPFLKIFANDNDHPIYLLVDSGAQRSVMRASELARINRSRPVTERIKVYRLPPKRKIDILAPTDRTSKWKGG